MREMKHSGIEWIGDIPSNWEVKKFKYLVFDIKSGDSLTNEILSDDHMLYPVFGGGKQIGYYKKSNVTSNNLLIGRVGANCGCVTKVIGKAWATDNALIVYSHDNIHYLYYLLLITNLNNMSDVNAQPLITAGKVLNIKIPFCTNIQEQRTIVAFLDAQCEKVDTIIALEETIISELNEYKKLIIQKAVTKGISNAPLKNSGFDWLGEIPQNWETKIFTSIFSFDKGLNITKEMLKETGVPVVSYGEIHSKYGRELNPVIHPLKFVSVKYLKTNENSLLQYGDFVFADTSEDIEGSGNFTFLNNNSNMKIFAGYHTIIARPKIKLNYLFLSFLCDSYTFRSQIQSSVTGIKVFSITKSLLKKTYIWLPPLAEQQAIAKYLNKKLRQVDKLITLKQ